MLGTLCAVGTGAFMLSEWRSGDRLIVDRNPNYWDKDKVKLDRIVFRIIPDQATRYAALSTTFGVTSPLIAASWSAPVARAYAGWCLLAAVCAYAVHDAASRGRIGASTFVTLRRGLRAHATCHAALVAAAIASAQLTPPLAAPVVAGALAALGFALP